MKNFKSRAKRLGKKIGVFDQSDDKTSAIDLLSTALQNTYNEGRIDAMNIVAALLKGPSDGEGCIHQEDPDLHDYSRGC